MNEIEMREWYQSSKISKKEKSNKCWIGFRNMGHEARNDGGLYGGVYYSTIEDGRYAKGYEKRHGLRQSKDRGPEWERRRMQGW